MAVQVDQIVRFSMRERVRLLAYVMVYVHDEHAAEDIIQDVVVLAIRKASQIKDDAHLMGWFRVACRYEALELKRQTARRPRLFDNTVLNLLDQAWTQDQSSGPPDELIDALHICIEQLSPGARKVVRLRYDEGLTGVSLAERLGRKLNTTYVAVARIHKVLHNCIEKTLSQHGKTSRELGNR